jgi:hypothetical protein
LFGGNLDQLDHFYKSSTLSANTCVTTTASTIRQQGNYATEEYVQLSCNTRNFTFFVGCQCPDMLSTFVKQISGTQTNMTILHFYLHNIPATQQKPFKILVKGKTEFETTSDVDSGAVDVEVLESGFASFVKVHINFLVNELNIDELNQYNITSNGDHFLVTIKAGRLDIKQRFDNRFKYKHI